MRISDENSLSWRNGAPDRFNPSQSRWAVQWDKKALQKTWSRCSKELGAGVPWSATVMLLDMLQLFHFEDCWGNFDMLVLIWHVLEYFGMWNVYCIFCIILFSAFQGNLKISLMFYYVLFRSCFELAVLFCISCICICPIGSRELVLLRVSRLALWHRCRRIGVANAWNQLRTGLNRFELFKWEFHVWLYCICIVFMHDSFLIPIFGVGIWVCRVWNHWPSLLCFIAMLLDITRLEVKKHSSNTNCTAGVLLLLWSNWTYPVYWSRFVLRT